MDRRLRSYDHLWGLDPQITYLNHGSFGATPKAILQTQFDFQKKMENAPAVFMREILPVELKKVRYSLSQFVNAPQEQLALVKNSTEATNAVLQSLQFGPGDEIVVTNHGYNAVTQTLKYLSDTKGVIQRVAKISYPLWDMDEVVSAIEKQISKNTKLIIVDHITSATALVFPIEKVVKLAKDYNILLFIDGAHAPGHLPIDLTHLKPDFYVGNFHKWMNAPKGCAFLYVDKNHLQNIHPLSISHYYKTHFTAEFDWTGTLDNSAWLCLPHCVDFFNDLGGFEDGGIVQRNKNLIFESAKMMQEELNLQWGHSLPTSNNCCMISQIVPDVNPEPDTHLKLISHIFRHYSIEIQATVFEQKLIVRLSAQAYNSLEQYKKFINCFKQIDFNALD